MQEPRSQGDSWQSGPGGTCLVSRESLSEACVQKMAGWDLAKEEQRECTRAEQGCTQEALHPRQPGAEGQSQVQGSEPGEGLQGEPGGYWRREGTGSRRLLSGHSSGPWAGREIGGVTGWGSRL